MKTRSVALIVILFSIALVGLLLSQLLWIKKSFHLKEEQFDHRVDMALNDVKEELKIYSDTSLKYQIIDSLECIRPKGILDVANPVILDSLLKKYTLYHNITIGYEYAVRRSRDDSVMYKSNGFVLKDKYDVFIVCFSCLWHYEAYHMAVIFPCKTSYIFMDIRVWTILSLIFIIIVASSFLYTVITFIKQKKISEIRNDFVNNMTHEFKTPISTIKLTSELLKKKLNELNDTNVNRYIDIILTENFRLQTQTERVLQTAVMEKGEYNLNKTLIDIHDLIKNTIKNLCLEICDDTAKVKYKLEAANPMIKADPVHITNIIVNLVQNAIKYSKDTPEITISTKNTNNNFILTVEDKGIGMGIDKIKYIFDKFYRIPTGNVHNVKGFGLGLYYVKSMTEAHGGKVKVVSQLNKGSRFDVILPVNGK